MNVGNTIPAWAALLTSLMVLLGAALTLIGTLGLLRFDSFYKRVHAPTLGTTLGAGSILVASIIFFSVLQTRAVVHEVLIAVFMTVTTPVTLMLLVRAAVSRDWQEKNPAVAEIRPKLATGNRQHSVVEDAAGDHSQA